MKKQKTRKFIEKDFEFDSILYGDLDIVKEKIPKKKMRNNVKRKKLNKKIDLKYIWTI